MEHKVVRRKVSVKKVSIFIFTVILLITMFVFRIKIRLIVCKLQFFTMIESDGQCGVNCAPWICGSEVQAVRRTVHIVENVVHSGL